MSQTLLAAGRAIVGRRSVDNAGSKPWDSWQNAVTKVGHAVNSQSPTKNTHRPRTKPSEIKENRPIGFMQEPILESINAAISLASRGITSCGCLCHLCCTFTSLAMSPAELQKQNNPVNVWMIHTHRPACTCLSMTMAWKLRLTLKTGLDISRKQCLVRLKCKE